MREMMMRLSTVECDYSGSWMGSFRWLGEREDLGEYSSSIPMNVSMGAVVCFKGISEKGTRIL